MKLKNFHGKSMHHTDFSKLRQNVGLTLPEVANISGYDLKTLYRWEKGEKNPSLVIMELLKRLTLERSAHIRKHTFTFIDLFAGIGGIRKAFEAAGGKCIFTSEWNAACLDTYRGNFQCDHDIAGDLTKVSTASVPKHNILLAGFPCQPFSIAGVSKRISLGNPHGFLCNAQGTLFFDVARLIAAHLPDAFMLENVRNLLFHDRGNTFNIIMKTLSEELGYNVSYRVINAKSFLPQNRERIYIVGFREKTDFDLANLHIPCLTEGPRLGSILHPEDGTEEAEEPYTQGEKAWVNPKYTLSGKLWQYLQDYAAKHQIKGNGFGYGLVGSEDVARTLSARYYKDGAEILVRQGTEKNPRRLTPRECARLMGFDRPGMKPMKIPVSDTQAYRQFGNSVAVPVVEAIAKYIISYMPRSLQPIAIEDFV